MKFVIIRAPPDFPFPFDEIAIRILKQFFPIGVPISGSILIFRTNTNNSYFKEAYFLKSLLVCFSKEEIVFTL